MIEKGKVMFNIKPEDMILEDFPEVHFGDNKGIGFVLFKPADEGLGGRAHIFRNLIGGRGFP